MWTVNYFSLVTDELFKLGFSVNSCPPHNLIPLALGM